MLVRSSGILLHPSSLPGTYGIGTLGKEAFAFVDLLKKAGQTWWQILPLGPTGYGDSPYQCFSSKAGNPYLIDMELLVEKGWLMEADLADAPAFDDAKVMYGDVIEWKMALLRKSEEYFLKNENAEFGQFLLANAHWIHDYALFMALKEKIQQTAMVRVGGEISQQRMLLLWKRNVLH
ncbi:MAG: 4-alpha-glucanotransferase [Chitinophagales bacterium]